MAILRTDGSGLALTDNNGKPLVLTTGSIIQVVNNTSNDINYTTSTSFLGSSLSVAITPKSSSSKILIISHFSANLETQEVPGDGCYYNLYRNDVTSLGDTSYGMGLISTNNPPLYTGASIIWLDSPNTTSTTSYKLFYRSKNGGIVSVVVGSGGESRYASITALEVVA